MVLDSDGCQGLKCPGNPITRQHIISQDGPKGFQKFPGGLNRLSWVTAVAPTVKTIPPKPCPGISEIGVFRNCPDPEMLVSPEPSSKSQVSRVKHFPWDVGGTPFLGTLGVRPSLGRWGYALPWDGDVGGTPFLLSFPRWDQISHAPTTIAETTNPAKAKPIVQTYLFCPLAKAPSVTPSANLVVQSKLLQKYK